LDHDHRLSCGYIVAPGEVLGIDGSKVLPEFALGSHRPGEDAGSTPLKTIYWFEDVLICLATSLDQEDVFEATIARTAKFGIKHGRNDFQAVILSLLDFILVEVHVENETIVVKHTNLIVLSPIWPEDHLSMDPREQLPRKGGDRILHSIGLEILRSGVAYQSLENLCKCFSGFITLVRSFQYCGESPPHAPFS
jgi:hypothetical protein